MKFTNHKKISSNKFVKIFLFSVATLMVLSLLAWYGIHRWYTTNLEPVSTSNQDIIVVVESGSSTATIGNDLVELGLIRNSTAFSWYIDRLDDSRFLQAGTYRMSANQSVQNIVEILLSGRVDTSLVTILPGLRLDQLETSLINLGYNPTEVREATKAVYDHPLLRDKPNNASLEGYIFPETYQVTAESSIADIIEQAFSVFSDLINSEISTGIARQGLTLHEAIILASIVQQEVPDPATQRQVAQVFLKRLDEGIILGSDVTFIYAAEILGVEPAVDIDSPYNTRINGGLPPGPISNFNFSALEAVANPTKTDYLYFVAGDDGETYFANTLSQHQANVEKYCNKLCE